MSRNRRRCGRGASWSSRLVFSSSWCFLVFSSRRCRGASNKRVLKLLSLFELPPKDSGHPARPGRPDSPRPTHFERLGRSSRSPSRSSRPESLRVARPSRFERPKSTEKLARAAPRRDFRRFCLDFGVDFRRFSRLPRASDSTHSAKGRTSVFAGRRSTFKGSQTLQKNRKSTKIDETSLRRCFTNAQREENSMFPLPDATWRRFWSSRRAPRRSRVLLSALERSRAILDAPPRRSWALLALLGVPWRSRARQGAP